jgi:hypothetical protein
VRALARSSILVATLVLARPALADDADALIARGLDLREAGKDEEALAVFRQALATRETPRARAQVALAEQALGMWVAAEADLEAALKAPEDPWITKNKGPLEGALAVIRRHLGSLEVRGGEGADVAIDGVRLGTLPAAKPFRVEAGRRTLEVQAKGFHPTSRAVEIPAGGVARETVTLVALPASSSPSTSGTSSGDRASPPPPSDGRTQRLLGWVTFGTGVALVATGTASLLVRQTIIDDYNNRCPGLGAAQPPDCDAKIDEARTWMTVSIVSFVAGGVLTAGGLTLVFTAPRAPQRTARTSPTLACAPGALAIACGGTF